MPSVVFLRVVFESTAVFVVFGLDEVFGFGAALTADFVVCFTGVDDFLTCGVGVGFTAGFVCALDAAEAKLKLKKQSAAIRTKIF